MALGWGYTKPFLPSECVCVCYPHRHDIAMHLFYCFILWILWFSALVNISGLHLSFLMFPFLFCFYLLFLMLSLELCRCSSDIFLSSRSNADIGNIVYYWM